MTSQAKYESLVQSCTEIISRVETIATSYKRILLKDDISLEDSIKELETSPFKYAKSKMKSQLINIAVCGEFSSGKSFLISALIGRLKWYERQPTPEDAYDQKDGYITFLPTAPVQTNSCPLEIIPVPEQESSRFEVMFDDTKRWEAKSTTGADDTEITGKMLAYATSIDQCREARIPEDIPRNVIRARLFISGMPIPAIIHDLPGIGGTGTNYLNTVNESLKESDCIVYVSSAIKDLTHAELDLLRLVEGISESNRIPVFFVLTQIDREPRWDDVRQKNNRFLHEFFIKDGSANNAFIGTGFLPLSAAMEAKACGMYLKKKVAIKARNNAINRSGMPSFRDLLQKYLITHSGPAHLKEIIEQMNIILKKIHLHLLNHITARTVQVENLNLDIQKTKESVDKLRDGCRFISEELGRIGTEALLASFIETNSTSLSKALEETATPLINTSDVLKDIERDNIQQQIKKTCEQWIKRPGGFSESWNNAWHNYQEQATFLLNKHLFATDADAATRSINPSVDSLPEIRDYGLDTKETIEIVKLALQFTTGIAATVGGSLYLGSIVIGSTTVALGPIGLFLLAFSALGFTTKKIKRHIDLKKAQKTLIEHIPKISDQLVAQLKRECEDILNKHRISITNTAYYLMLIQQSKVIALEKRLRTEDPRNYLLKIEELERLNRECEETKVLIENFTQM